MIDTKLNDFDPGNCERARVVARPLAHARSDTAFSHIARLPSLVLLALIRLYQHTLSPALPVLTAGACGCRFSPTCSHYAADAVRTHGAFLGTWLALRRLVKCTPLHPGGFDPVPPGTRSQRTVPPVCTRRPT